MALTSQEQVQIRKHLGFLNVAEAFTFVLGTPAGVETQFIIEGATKRLLVDAEPAVRKCLCELDQLEDAKQQTALDASVSKVGSIEQRDATTAMSAIDMQLNYKRGELANYFGVYRNSFDKRQRNGLNISVRR